MFSQRRSHYWSQQSRTFFFKGFSAKQQKKPKKAANYSVIEQNALSDKHKKWAVKPTIRPDIVRWPPVILSPDKWLSNSTKVLERIPVESRASEVHIANDGLPMVKTLGVTWLPGEDVFTFNANPPEKDFPLTKRNFLKKIAKLFDPVGFLAPFIIRAKILLQEMWAAGMDWDDLFLGDLASKARKWFKELEDLPTIKVPRCLRLGQNITYFRRRVTRRLWSCCLLKSNL